jgi:hypothetical protein
VADAAAAGAGTFAFEVAHYINALREKSVAVLEVETEVQSVLFVGRQRLGGGSSARYDQQDPLRATHFIIFVKLGSAEIVPKLSGCPCPHWQGVPCCLLWPRSSTEALAPKPGYVVNFTFVMR